MKAESFLTAARAEGLRRFSASAGVFIGITAVIVLLAWAGHVERVARILPRMVAMNPVTAVAFIFLGASLWLKLTSHRVAGAWEGRVPSLLAALVVLIGLIKLTQCLTGWGFHIDRLLFASRLGAHDGQPASEMAPNAALAFVLSGLAMMIMDAEWRLGKRPGQWLALATGLIAMLALIGYSYSVLFLYKVRGAMPMALATAINFMVFCLGFLAARPRHGIMELITSASNGGAVARRLLPMAVFVPWIIGAILFGAEQKSYFHTESVISIFALASIFIFTALVWWNARLLHRTDLERVRAQQRLERASANLERSNADLQQFAYTASHDLNEPLRMITSYLQLLEHRLKDKLDPQSHEFIAFALDGADRMRALIADLLAYSRLEAKPAAFQEIDCEQIFQTAVQNLKVAIAENKARIEHGPLPRVQGDRVQLTQVFQNLIGNALKFHGAQPPLVQVGAKPDKDEWIFSVKDNGIGIEPQYFERIFVIFQRLHTRQEYSGTGMGLSICKKIIERHGGRIWVESVPGKGSTFFFTLPAPSLELNNEH